MAQSAKWEHHEDRIGIWICWFLRRGHKVPGEKPSWSMDENQQQTQPTYDTESGNRTQAISVGGETICAYQLVKLFQEKKAVISCDIVNSISILFLMQLARNRFFLYS